MQHDPTQPRGPTAAASGAPDRIAAAIAELRVQRARRDHARAQLAEIERDFVRALRAAVAAGASYRELVEPAGLQKSTVGELAKGAGDAR